MEKRGLSAFVAALLAMTALYRPTPALAQAGEIFPFMEVVASIVSALTLHQLHKKNVEAANNIRSVGLNNNFGGEIFKNNGAAIVNDALNLNNLPGLDVNLNIVFNYNSTYSFPDWGNGQGQGAATIVGNADVFGNVGFVVQVFPSGNLSLLLEVPFSASYKLTTQYIVFHTIQNDGLWHQVFLQLSLNGLNYWVFNGYHTSADGGVRQFDPYSTLLYVNGALQGYAIAGSSPYAQAAAHNIGLKVSLAGYPMTWYVGNQVLPRSSGGYMVTQPNLGYSGDLAGLIVQPGFYGSPAEYAAIQAFYTPAINKAVLPTFDPGSGLSGQGMFGSGSPAPPVVLNGNQFPPGFQYNQGIQGGGPTSFIQPNQSFISLGEPFSLSDPFP